MFSFPKLFENVLKNVFSNFVWVFQKLFGMFLFKIFTTFQNFYWNFKKMSMYPQIVHFFKCSCFNFFSGISFFLCVPNFVPSFKNICVSTFCFGI